MFEHGLTRRAALAAWLRRSCARRGPRISPRRRSRCCGCPRRGRSSSRRRRAGSRRRASTSRSRTSPPRPSRRSPSSSGDADFGMTAFTAGFYNLAAKGGLKVIAAQSAERPGYPLVAIAVTNAAWDAGVRSIKDLAGKRIGHDHRRLLDALFDRDRRAQARRRYQDHHHGAAAARCPTWRRPSRAARSTARSFR